MKIEKILEILVDISEGLPINEENRDHFENILDDMGLDIDIYQEALDHLNK